MLESPIFYLDINGYYVVNFEFETSKESHIFLKLVNCEKNRVIKEREQKGAGEFISSIGFTAKTNTGYKLQLFCIPDQNKTTLLLRFKINLHFYDQLYRSGTERSTYLDHWGFLQRLIHRLCKKSKHFNIVISSLEMHLGRTEVLSLPSFIALCPTGRCNAKCLFCSVAENRNGILKNDMPKLPLETLLDQIGKTVWMYGIEGNGEPLLYKYISQLFTSIISRNAKAYLISNGSLLNDMLVNLLSSDRIDSINISLNAASGKVHNKVMGLKSFDQIKSNIKKIVHRRGLSINPFLSISLVVNQLNIHEIIDFVKLSEALNVDRVNIRPLSEIATSDGTIEDIRSFVPYDIQVKNLKDEIEDYINDNKPNTEIIFDYASFRAVRTYPLAGKIPIHPFESLIIPPNKRYWKYDKHLISTMWYLNTVKLEWNTNKDAVFSSCPIPSKEYAPLAFGFNISVAKGTVTIEIDDENQRTLAQRTFNSEEFLTKSSESIQLNSGKSDWITIRIHGTAGSIANFGFEKVQAYPKRIKRYELLADFNKWELNIEGLKCHRLYGRFQLQYNGPKYIYLLKSYSIPSYSNEFIELCATINVSCGELGIGILSADSLDWITTFAFPVGVYEKSISFNTGPNEKFFIVLYSNSDDELISDIKWHSFNSVKDKVNHDENQKDATADFISLPNVQENYNKDNNKGPAQNDSDLRHSPKSVRSENIKDDMFNIREKIKRHARIYCQKPWTDLNNFSVDGRMDVCCITTGESQEKYALGNLCVDNFQEIWNGPVVKRFRSTVNVESKRLPPCSRCPMAYQKQGLFFDFYFTKGYFKGVFNILIRELKPIKVLRRSKLVFCSTLGLFKKKVSE